MRWLAVLLLLSLPAFGQEARDLGYLSAEQTEESRYGGVGWMRASRGLDHDGPVMTLEAGRSFPDSQRIGLMAGWRWLLGRTYLTALAGYESGDDPGLAGSLDLWWNEGAWMASARSQVVPGPDSGRLAAGRRIWPGGPWFGPELTANWQGERLGLHATGIRLPWRMEARLSAGATVRERAGHGGGFLELSLWRRF